MKKTIKTALAIILALTVALCVVACGETGTNTVSISIETASETISAGDTVTLVATVTGADDKTVTWSSSDETVLAVNDKGEVTVVAAPAEDTVVTVTATSNADASKKATHVFTVQKATLNVSIRLDAAPLNIKFGDKVTLVATVTGADDKTVTWSSSDETVLAVNDKGEVTVVAAPVAQTAVTITATANADASKKASHTFTVQNKIEQGTVGDLTSEMIAKIGSSEITVTGSVTSYYVDYLTASNSFNSEYVMTVKMEDGKWSGSYNLKENPLNVISDVYLRGNDQVTDANKVSGHALETVYIDKNNQLKTEIVKDYSSVPAVWETQHLYNHLNQLSITKFTYDENAGAYKYNIVPINEYGTNYYKDDGSGEVDMTKPAAIDAFLMAYLTHSLTPMLESDNAFVDLYIYVKDGEITGLYAEGAKSYSYDSNGKPTEMAYVAVELSFSGVGDTTVDMPKPYSGPAAFAEPLKNALSEIKSATSYTYDLKNVTTYSPSYSDDDYGISSTDGGVSLMSTTVHNGVYETGTVGSVAYVTPDAVLFKNTTKYVYSLDGKNFKVEWSGYRQMSYGSETQEAYYEEFAYAKDSDGAGTPAMKGVKRIYGLISEDIMPTFDFSADVFEFDHSERDKNTGKMRYTFYLVATKATKEVAMSMSAYSYAKNATNDTEVLLTVTVSEDGHLISTCFPYDISYGVYYGYCTTTYYDVNSTTLPEGVFNDYVEREMKVNWNQYILTDYYYEHTTKWTEEQATANAETVLRAIFKDSFADVPSPDKLMNVFGDEIHGPFFNWTTVEENGEKIYHDYMSITTLSNNYDENSRITDYDEIIAQLDKQLIDGCGFKKSYNNCGESGGSRYVTYVKGDVLIVVENNYTRYFWISFRVAGTWTLKK